MAIEKSISKVDKFTDSLKSTQFKEAGAPGKIETAVKKPPYSYLADLKILALDLGFTYVNNSNEEILEYKRGDWKLFLHVNPKLGEIVPGGPKFINSNAHKAYFQWNLEAPDTNIFGLTPTELFFLVKG